MFVCNDFKWIRKIFLLIIYLNEITSEICVENLQEISIWNLFNKRTTTWLKDPRDNLRQFEIGGYCIMKRKEEY